MKRPRILLDADGVIADFLTEALRVINKKSKRKGKERFTEQHVTQWDICKSVGMPEMWAEIHKAARKPGFCKKISPYPHAKQGVNLLKEMGEVFVVTSPLSTPYWTHERGEWLKEHFEIEKPNVVHTEAKHIIVGDVLIDDKFENIESWVNHHEYGLGLLWDAPYNRSASWPVHCDRIVRVCNWEDAISEIQAHLAEDDENSV